MAVAFDAFTASSESTSSTSFTFSHNPVGTPRAVIVLIAQADGGTDEVTGVTYDGTSLTEMTNSPALRNTGEEGAAYAYFLGSSVPTTDPADVVVSTNAGSAKIGYCITLTAGGDVEETDTGTVLSDSQVDPTVTLSLGGKTAFAAIAAMSGRNNVPGQCAPFANWTSRAENDSGADGQLCYTFDTIGSTDVSAGYTAGADDVSMIAVAVNEVAGAITPTVGEGTLSGTSGWPMDFGIPVPTEA